jgi:DNA-binding NarL/FixJ family response regulator
MRRSAKKTASEHGFSFSSEKPKVIRNSAPRKESSVSIRVAIFEPTQMSCELMARALESSPYDIEVVATAVSAEMADVSALKDTNVVVIGTRLREGHLSGFTLLRRLTKASFDLNCILLVERDEQELVIEAFRSGAVGICERDQPYEQLCKCIVCVSKGQVWANSRQMRYILRALANGLPPLITDAKGQVLLSKREHEIVSKVAEGMKNREIAELLGVSEHTIKNHLFRVFERLGISSRAELILYLHGQRLKLDSSSVAADNHSNATESRDCAVQMGTNLKHK